MHSGKRIPDNTCSSYSIQSFYRRSSSWALDHAPGIYSWVELSCAEYSTGIQWLSHIGPVRVRSCNNINSRSFPKIPESYRPMSYFRAEFSCKLNSFKNERKRFEADTKATGKYPTRLKWLSSYMELPRDLQETCMPSWKEGNVAPYITLCLS